MDRDLDFSASFTFKNSYIVNVIGGAYRSTQRVAMKKGDGWVVKLDTGRQLFIAGRDVEIVASVDHAQKLIQSAMEDCRLIKSGNRSVELLQTIVDYIVEERIDGSQFRRGRRFERLTDAEEFFEHLMRSNWPPDTDPGVKIGVDQAT